MIIFSNTTFTSWVNIHNNAYIIIYVIPHDFSGHDIHAHVKAMVFSCVLTILYSQKVLSNYIRSLKNYNCKFATHINFCSIIL